MKYCKKCLLPDTRPSITINRDGTCSGCIGDQFKQAGIDWPARARELDRLVAEAKSRATSYDCIVPVSGGKDSWYQIIKAKQFGLRPLAVTWRTPGLTEIGRRNLEVMIDKLNVDHIWVTIAPETERRFMVAAFEERGDPGLPMHMAIFTVPNRMAVDLRVPMVLWGENPQLEFGGTDLERLATEMTPDWFANHGCMQGTTWRDWIGKQGLTEADLQAYRLPETMDFVPKAIFLGAFLKWDSFENAKIAQQHGFIWESEGARTGTWDFADIDCDFVSLHHYPKWHKFGMSRAFDNLSVQIRQGLITRDAAVDVLKRVGMQTPHKDIAAFCAFVGKPESWFWETIETFRNKDIWERRGNRWVVKDFLIPDFSWE